MKNNNARVNADMVGLPPMPVALGMVAVVVLLVSMFYTGFKFQLW